MRTQSEPVTAVAGQFLSHPSTYSVRKMPKSHVFEPDLVTNCTLFLIDDVPCRNLKAYKKSFIKSIYLQVKLKEGRT
jgi:hypothetical protein